MNLATLHHVHGSVIPDALALLPGRMTSHEARAMMLATGLQESEFNARRQGGHGVRPGNGPARGFWQFEKLGGVLEILTATDTRPYVLPVLDLLLYGPQATRAQEAATCHAAIEHNDVLAAVFARLLLWRDPRSLPGPLHADVGWAIYLARWRPGKPHPATWPGYYEQAWKIVGETS
jgi:hypothetical protein